MQQSQERITDELPQIIIEPDERTQLLALLATERERNARLSNQLAQKHAQNLRLGQTVKIAMDALTQIHTQAAITTHFDDTTHAFYRVVAETAIIEMTNGGQPS
jgi:transcription initiation factor TFIIIB Brf1 subunit/transcription initiation factor TFIIB